MMKETPDKIKEFFGQALRQAGKVLSFLTFSAADERFHKARKVLSLSIEKGAVNAALESGFLSRMKIKKKNRMEVRDKEYPEPADLVMAAKSVCDLLPLGNSTLVIPGEWVIERNAEFPASIRHDIANAVSYDLDRILPFGADRMFYDWRVTGENGKKITLQVSAVKLEKVKPYIDKLRENGIAISRLIYAAGKSRQADNCQNLLTNGRRETVKTPVAGTVFFILLILVVWVHRITSPIGVERGKVEALNRQVSLERRKVFGVDGLIKQAGALNGEIAAINGFDTGTPRALRTIKELTAVIPKSAWLTGLKLKGDSVQIEGYAASATGLIPKLERSGYFKKAEFASPTLRDAKTKSDRFVIKMIIVNAAHPGNMKPASTGKAKNEKRKSA